MNNKEIEKKVLKKINPSNQDKKELEKVIHQLKKEVKNLIEKLNLNISIELVGSTAKDTFLKNNLDIDLFLVFPTTFKKEEIAKISLDIGKKILKNSEESYAEHPYLRGYYKNYKTEIVPCYKIEKASQKLSAVDRTPLHTRYVKEHIKEKQKKDVRLLKQFLTGIGCYGAEAEIEGFSGYLCEILILKYETFSNLIKHATKWKHKETLTLTKESNLEFNTPLIFIDPVDIERNVSSALSKEKFDLFKKACNTYLKNPSIKFFFPNKIKPLTVKEINEKIKKEKDRFIGIRFEKPDIISENLYPQVRKAVRSIRKALTMNDFIIKDATFNINDENKKIFILIKSDKNELSDTIIHVGPPKNLKHNSQEFIDKWKNNSKLIKGPYLKDDRYYAEIKRDYTQIIKFLNEKLPELSLGKYLDNIIKDNYEILEDQELVNIDSRIFWTKYFEKKLPWEW